MLQPEPLSLDGWTANARIPESPSGADAPTYPAVSLPPLTLLLHGWQGDETVMWVFANRLPENHLLVAPRAIYPSPDGGYSWVEHMNEGYPTFEDFQPAVHSLLDLLKKIKSALDHDPSPVNLVGFSQGAALAQAFAATYPSRVGLLAGLAGFTPLGMENLPAQPLAGKHVFIAHGTEDETVPVEVARQGIAALEKLGATVTYCEDNVGHKLSANCFRALADYFKA